MAEVYRSQTGGEIGANQIAGITARRGLNIGGSSGQACMKNDPMRSSWRPECETCAMVFDNMVCRDGEKPNKRQDARGLLPPRGRGRGLGRGGGLGCGENGIL